LIFISLDILNNRYFWLVDILTVRCFDCSIFRLPSFPTEPFFFFAADRNTYVRMELWTVGVVRIPDADQHSSCIIFPETVYYSIMYTDGLKSRISLYRILIVRQIRFSTVYNNVQTTSDAIDVFLFFVLCFWFPVFFLSVDN